MERTTLEESISSENSILELGISNFPLQMEDRKPISCEEKTSVKNNENCSLFHCLYIVVLVLDSTHRINSIRQCTVGSLVGELPSRVVLIEIDDDQSDWGQLPGQNLPSNTLMQ